MSEPYYSEPLAPQPGQWHDRRIDPTEVSDVGAASPRDDPTNPAASPRGEVHPTKEP